MEISWLSQHSSWKCSVAAVSVWHTSPSFTFTPHFFFIPYFPLHSIQSRSPLFRPLALSIAALPSCTLLVFHGPYKTGLAQGGATIFFCFFLQNVGATKGGSVMQMNEAVFSYNWKSDLIKHRTVYCTFCLLQPTLRTTCLCACSPCRCFIMEDRGYLVAHPTLIDPKGHAPAEQQHITHKVNTQNNVSNKHLNECTC